MAKLTVEEIYRSDKHTLIAAKKMIEEGGSISDISKLQLPSLYEEEK